MTELYREKGRIKQLLKKFKEVIPKNKLSEENVHLKKAWNE